MQISKKAIYQGAAISVPVDLLAEGEEAVNVRRGWLTYETSQGLKLLTAEGWVTLVPPFNQEEGT